MDINDQKVMKKWPTDYNYILFKEFFCFFNIYVLGQDDQQNAIVGQGGQQNDKFGQKVRYPPHPRERRGSPASTLNTVVIGLLTQYITFSKSFNKDLRGWCENVKILKFLNTMFNIVYTINISLILWWLEYKLIYYTKVIVYKFYITC